MQYIYKSNVPDKDFSIGFKAMKCPLVKSSAPECANLMVDAVCARSPESIIGRDTPTQVYTELYISHIV
jgi:hypothetical protein